MKGCNDVYASFDKYVEVERLEGDNKYHAEEHGLQVCTVNDLIQAFLSACIYICGCLWVMSFEVVFFVYCGLLRIKQVLRLSVRISRI